MTDPVVLAAVVTTVGVIVTALIGVLFQNVKLGRRIDKVHDKAEVVRDQVQNSHGTNLRDDLDRIRAEQREGFRSIEERQDIAAETVIAVRKEAQQAATAVDQKVVDLTRRLDRHIDGSAK